MPATFHSQCLAILFLVMTLVATQAAAQSAEFRISDRRAEIPGLSTMQGALNFRHLSPELLHIPLNFDSKQSESLKAGDWTDVEFQPTGSMENAATSGPWEPLAMVAGYSETATPLFAPEMYPAVNHSNFLQYSLQFFADANSPTLFPEFVNRSNIDSNGLFDRNWSSVFREFHPGPLLLPTVVNEIGNSNRSGPANKSPWPNQVSRNAQPDHLAVVSPRPTEGAGVAIPEPCAAVAWLLGCCLTTLASRRNRLASA